MIEKLKEQKATLIAYLLSKIRSEDWHACADACMDLREIEARIEVYEVWENTTKVVKQ